MSRLDELWNELIFDALASDGAISDQDVKMAVKRWRPKIEGAIEHRVRMREGDIDAAIEEATWD